MPLNAFNCGIVLDLMSVQFLNQFPQLAFTSYYIGTIITGYFLRHSPPSSHSCQCIQKCTCVHAIDNLKMDSSDIHTSENTHVSLGTSSASTLLCHKWSSKVQGCDSECSVGGSHPTAWKWGHHLACWLGIQFVAHHAVCSNLSDQLSKCRYPELSSNPGHYHTGTTMTTLHM